MAVTFVEENAGGLAKIKATWLSDTAGAATGTTTYPYNAYPIRVSFVPDGGGTAPTDAYDIVVTDSDGIDILNGNGANLSSTVTATKTPNDGIAPFTGKLTVTVANAGEANGGNVYLYLQPINGRK